MITKEQEKHLRSVMRKLGKEQADGISVAMIQAMLQGENALCYPAVQSFIKNGIMRKTRSKKMPVMPTDVGHWWMEHTKSGKTYLSLGR